MTDEPGADGGLISSGDAVMPLSDGCTFRLPDHMPSRQAVEISVRFGSAADRLDLARLDQWIRNARRESFLPWDGP